MKKYQLLGSVGPIYPFVPPVLRQRQSQSRGHSEPLRSVPPTSIDLSQPLAKGERGGIIGIAAKINPSEDGNGVNLITRGIDEGAIKVALLFVDKLDKPTNSLMGFGEDDPKDVTGIGLGGQTMVTYTEGLTYSQTSNYIWQVYQLLDKREPGRWSLWPQRDTPIIPEQQLSPDLAFRLELQSGLIVPAPSTPYEDVLAFKDRHKAELIALRHYLEEFAIKLSKEGDPRAVNLERERFDAALAEYLTKARHSNVRKAVASLTTEFDWTAAVRGAVGGGGIAVAAQGLSLIAAAAAIGNGILAGLSIKSVAGLKDGPSPFRYIARIEKEYGS
ncbi:DUF6236 family protein [Sphingomonas sanguinis]|uniref:Uncharacterized protein n=1 Tax=Sphingomonas sanguinis TaxID=33051 RepID=A0A147IK05_9SPHN|nr:DUF6236 family protein [Sphingomonas sanguinis]KTT95009.1 hypothetical protein SB4_17440 [Sphingomonas sanguinis]